jgi:hypothetical protein
MRLQTKKRGRPTQISESAIELMRRDRSTSLDTSMGRSSARYGHYRSKTDDRGIVSNNSNHSLDDA